MWNYPEMQSRLEMVNVEKNKYLLGALVEPLCLWYEENKRSMPWRDDATPYHVWLSEIMLQQTRIEAAKSYYKRFTEQLPDVYSLANVSEERLLKLWEGLGYYNRARNLQKAAKLVVERYEGKLPSSYDLLLDLPGIGNYTAGAIASIAYGVPAPAVDGNVLRVVMRFLNCNDDIMKQSVRRRVEQSIMDIIPQDKPGDFNQALMELGEVVCIPNGRPLCEKCPLEQICKAHAAKTEEALPVKPEKKKKTIEKRTIHLLVCGDKIAIEKRPEKGLLAGLWGFPGVSGYQTKSKVEEWLKQFEIQNAKVKPLQEAKHIFSHVEWHMRGYRIELSAIPQHIVPDVKWVAIEDLQKKYAIPIAFHAFLKTLIL